jgi:DNA primase
VIDQVTKDKILDAANIVDVVSEFVTLRKRGVNYVGLCPFHADKTPSFYVSPSKNICKCFSCGEGGAPVYFIMKHEQLSYNEALKFLAKKYNIEVQEREITDSELQMRNARESMFIVNSWAQKHFTSRLFEHDEGRTVGLSYFNERGFREDTIRKFQLGYALEKRDDLYLTALQNGYKAEFLEKTGLVGFYENGTVADRFRGRVIFPVHTMSGKVVAFGGRILKKNEKVGKYINSPESDIYHKSHELYGLFFAKQAIAKADKCFLVEGYTDVISMYQAGVENVVASSGTALTPGQINLIRRITNNITVIYDGDAPGIKAAIRGIDLLLEEGMNVKIVLLPEGDDPDSFARKRNAFEFDVFINEHETDFIRFKTNLLLEETGNDPIKKASLIGDILQSIAVIPDNIIRSVYIKDCSDLLDIKEQTLINELNKIRLNKRKAADIARQNATVSTQNQPFEDNGKSSEDADIPPNHVTAEDNERQNISLNGTQEEDANTYKSQPSPYKACEEALLRYIVQFGEFVLYDYIKDNEHITIRVAEYIHSVLQEDDLTFYTPSYRTMLEECVRLCQGPHFSASRHFLSHPNPVISRIAIDLTDEKYNPQIDLPQTTDTTSMSEKERKEWERSVEKKIDDVERMIRHDLFSLKNAFIMQQISDISNELKDLQKRGETDESIKLIKKLQQLNDIKNVLCKELGERIILKM